MSLVWTELTAIVQDLDNKYEYDILNSLYANLKYNVDIQEVLTLESKYEGNLPGLAYDYYGDMEMWRVIMWTNGLRDPFDDVIAGCALNMPSMASVLAYLSRTKVKAGNNANKVTI